MMLGLLVLLDLVEDRAGLEPDAVVVVLGVATGPDSPGPKTEEHRPDQFPETRCVHRILLRFITGKESAL